MPPLGELPYQHHYYSLLFCPSLHARILLACLRADEIDGLLAHRRWDSTTILVVTNLILAASLSDLFFLKILTTSIYFNACILQRSKVKHFFTAEMAKLFRYIRLGNSKL